MMATVRQTIYIDEQFRDLLPTPTTEAIRELEESLLSEGCREPLVVWEHDGRHIMLDGHTRQVICDAHGIQYRTIGVDLPDRDAAMDWIERNQLGRRNLAPQEFALILGRRYNRLKQRGARTDRTCAQSEHKLAGRRDTTAEKLAREHGTSAATVRRAGEFAEAVEKGKERDPQIERKIVQGEISRKEVMEKAKPRVTPAPAKDADGRDIPAHLAGVFEAREQFKQFAQTLSTLKGQVEQAIKADPVAWSQFSDNAFRAAIAKAHDLLTLSGPFIVCSYCGGSDSDKCRACKGAGFLSRAQARCAPKELRP